MKRSGNDRRKTTGRLNTSGIKRSGIERRNRAILREVCPKHQYSLLQPRSGNDAAMCNECVAEAFARNDTRKIGDIIAVKDLRLGDTVALFAGAYNCATVANIDGETVYLKRPYATHDNFSYTGGVIVTYGVETCIYFKTQHQTFTLLTKGGYLR